MVVLVGLGERLAERFLPIYIMALGGGAIAIGLLNAMGQSARPHSTPSPVAPCRFGSGPSGPFCSSIWVSMVSALSSWSPTWQAVLVGAVLFISWSAISLPATISLMYQVLPQDRRTMGVTQHSLVRRIPMARAGSWRYLY